MSKVDQILQFWFGRPGSADYNQFQPWWFQASARVDRELRERWAADYSLAAAGYLDGWQGWPQSCLALVLLLDQLPRYLGRGTTSAWETDAAALTIAKQAIAEGFDREFPPLQRWFFYFPLKHSENLSDQEQCLALIHSLPDHPEKAQVVSAVTRYHELIQKFGRFPHRNALLGRVSTPAELAYLQNLDASQG